MKKKKKIFEHAKNQKYSSKQISVTSICNQEKKGKNNQLGIQDEKIIGKVSSTYTREIK